MLIRIIDVHVRPERFDDWMRFTRDAGFPAMLRQPGCRAIWRLKRPGAAYDFQVMTLWESAAQLQHFRESDAMRELTAGAAPLTLPPPGETIYEVIDDPPA